MEAFLTWTKLLCSRGFCKVGHLDQVVQVSAVQGKVQVGRRTFRQMEGMNCTV